jgi:hypothetical protein
MQFQVPQFIETEDRIIGPFTLKQFAYIGGAAAVSAVFYFTLPMFWWVILSLPVVALGIGLAFVKVNGQPLPKIVAAAAGFYLHPQTYVWQPDHPTLPKNEATLKSAVGAGFSLESILSGLALRHAREQVLTGSQASADAARRTASRSAERYEIFRGIGGERRAARRIDYR